MQDQPIKILLVEDNEGDARLFHEILRTSALFDFEVTRVSRLSEAVQSLGAAHPDVILLDLMLPDSYGMETVERTRAVASDIPIVVLTGLADEEFGIEAMRHGAQDYLIKGQLSSPLLVRAIRYAMERQRLLIELNSLALTDSLTGLHNRRSFMALAGQQIKLAQRTGRMMMLLFIDLDGLKQINDGHGHAQGDRAIIAAAEILQATFRTSDIVARIGGDEFVVLTLEANTGCESVMIPRLYQNFADYQSGRNLDFTLSFSIGTACFYPNDPVSLESLMEQADRALYTSKHRQNRAG